MKLKLHHVNLSTKNVPQMEQFYKDVLGLVDEDESLLPPLDRKDGIVGDVAFVTDGSIQTHLAEQDIDMGFKTGHIVNPLANGHIAYRTDDLEAFRAHLDQLGVQYSDWGNTAVQGWRQIFFYDPDGNVIEVHETG